MDSYKDLSIWGKLFFWFVFTLGAVIITMIIETARANGAVDYCWIRASAFNNVPETYYYLNGHRSWREDVQMGIFKSYEEAIAATEKAACPLYQ